MVTPVRTWQPIMTNHRKKGLVVEIIGPAGAGKSTLYEAMGMLGAGFVKEPLPPVWDFSYLLFFVKNIIALVPMLMHLPGKGARRITREELAWMAMLNGWPELLKRQTLHSPDVVLLDQGPIFLMGTLLGFGPHSLQNPQIQPWWNKIIGRWKKAIDIVVWLDSSDELLTTRIRKREQCHEVKESPDQEVREFLAEWRKVFDQVMRSMLVNNQRLQVIRINTGQTTVDEIVRKVLSEIDTREQTLP